MSLANQEFEIMSLVLDKYFLEEENSPTVITKRGYLEPSIFPNMLQGTVIHQIFTYDAMLKEDEENIILYENPVTVGGRDIRDMLAANITMFKKKQIEGLECFAGFSHCSDVSQNGFIYGNYRLGQPTNFSVLKVLESNRTIDEVCSMVLKEEWDKLKNQVVNKYDLLETNNEITGKQVDRARELYIATFGLDVIEDTWERPIIFQDEECNTQLAYMGLVRDLHPVATAKVWQQYNIAIPLYELSAEDCRKVSERTGCYMHQAPRIFSILEYIHSRFGCEWKCDDLDDVKASIYEVYLGVDERIFPEQVI